MRRRHLVVGGIFLLRALSFAPLALANARNPQRSSSPASVSHVRAVSLSLVEGTVIVRMPEAGKWARATLNMPIEQGISIATARHSFAEVQFENGSTVRIGELSCMGFT